MPEIIDSKVRMYQLLNTGKLGHTLPAVQTVEAAEEFVRKHTCTFGLRFLSAAGKTRYGLSADEALALVRSLPAGTWNLSPTLEDRYRVCYGHLLDGPGGWNLHYTDAEKPAKLLPSVDGCVEKHLTGLAARMYLRGIMDDRGWETLRHLLDEYPDHCVEFSVMSSSLAAYGPSNTIVWEVRQASLDQTPLTGSYERSAGWSLM